MLNVSFGTFDLEIDLVNFLKSQSVFKASRESCSKPLLKGKWQRVFTYSIVDYGVHTSFGNHTFLRPISKSFLTFKDINKKVSDPIDLQL